MTDAELSERVARECLGLELCSHQWDSPFGLCWKFGPDSHGGFAPSLDARDAERVWDWLVGHVDGMSISRGNPEAGCSLRYWPKPPGEDGDPEYVDAPDYKRALCLAALEVANDQNKS